MNAVKYPLEALRRVREVRAEEASRALAARVRAREAADARRVRAARARALHEDTVRAEREDSRSRLVRGELRAADLARAAGYDTKVAGERARLLEDEARACAAVDEARAAESLARAEAGQREAEAAVVRRDHARFELAALRARDARDEDAAAEATARSTGS